jgi:YgiT-type zinc finger domain-containing protein
MEPHIHKKKTIMKCPHCKSELKQGTTVLTFQLNSDQIVVVKDVPALVCEQCGEESLDLETSKIVEKQVQQAVADGIQMGFINFNTAA